MVSQPNTNSGPQSKRPLSHQQSETPAWTCCITRHSSTPTWTCSNTISAVKNSTALSDSGIYTTGHKINTITPSLQDIICAAIKRPFGRREDWKDLRSLLVRHHAAVNIAEKGSLTIFLTLTKKLNVALNDIKHKAQITYTSKIMFCALLLWKLRLSPIFCYYGYVPYYGNNP